MIALVVIFVISMAAEAYLADFLISNRNTIPGGMFTIPFAAHGQPVFVSKREWNIYWGLSYSKFVFAALYGILYLIRRHIRRQRSDR